MTLVKKITFGLTLAGLSILIFLARSNFILDRAWVKIPLAVVFFIWIIYEFIKKKKE